MNLDVNEDTMEAIIKAFLLADYRSAKTRYREWGDRYDWKLAKALKRTLCYYSNATEIEALERL